MRTCVSADNIRLYQAIAAAVPLHLLLSVSVCRHNVPSFILKLTHIVMTFSKYFHTHQMCCFLGYWSLRVLLITFCTFNHIQMAPLPPHSLHFVKYWCCCCCWYFHFEQELNDSMSMILNAKEICQNLMSMLLLGASFLLSSSTTICIHIQLDVTRWIMSIIF